MKKSIRLSTRFALVILSGILVPLCLPPFGWWPLSLGSITLLLLATTTSTPRRAFYLGMLQGAIGYGTTLYWFFHIFAAAAMPLFAVMGLFTAVFCLLFNALDKQIRSPVLKVFVAATLWTAIEFYRSEVFVLRFPWVTPGVALGPTMLSPILGVYGASFLIVTAAAGFVYRKTVPLALLLSLCVLSLGLFRPGPVNEPDKTVSITVTVAQSEDCFLPSYVALTKAARVSPDLIIWPEYALPYDVRKNAADFKILMDLCAEMNAILVVGTKTTVGPGSGDWHNTALILDQRGVLGEYYKARPVHFFNDGIPGRRFTPVPTAIGVMGTPICFDCDYSEVVRKMVKLGAAFLAAPSFDAESWSVNQHLQHALLFRLRAAENARWLACAASSGISQVIDPHGQVHNSLPPMKTGALTSRIARSNRITFFTRAGWLFPWLTLAGSIITLAYATIKRLIPKKT